MRRYGVKAQDAVIPQILDEGMITHDNISRAEAMAQQDGTESVMFHLVQMGIVEPEPLLQVLSEHFRVDGVNLSDVYPDEKILSLLDAETAVSHRVLPIRRENRRYIVAMADPRDVNALDAVQFALGETVVPVVADTYTLARKIDQSYNRAGEQLQRTLLDFDKDVTVEVIDPLAEMQDEIDEAPIVKVIDATLHEAVRRRASDIHIEPVSDTELRFRFRIDGVLQEQERTGIRLRDAILSRIKILADLNIAEKHHPQDGRIKLKIGNRVIDFRVSTMPTSRGEKAVIRILDKTAISLDLETLGIDPAGLDVIQKTLASPYGMIVATGPTGAGKTTTLYSMLLKVNNEGINVLTAEDPIEYDLDGISQTQVRVDQGLDFADILRSFLRQDPNVIMVGEMRDLDTVQVALRAANTGHLVLSTLHTNDAASAFTRMLDMGAERFNIATAVTTVVAQRLVRRVCQKCKEPATYTADYLRLAERVPGELDGITFWKGAGCPDCDHTGYAGRLGLFEVMPVTTRLRQMIVGDQTSAEEIKTAAREEGMTTLREVGVDRARKGVTTLEEVVAHTSHH